MAHSYGGAISESYATGKVVVGASGIAGGLVAQNVAIITNSYWDLESTGQPSSAGGIRIDTIYQLKTQLPGGFDSTVWGVYPAGVLLPYSYGAIYPYLKWQSFLGIDGFPLHNPHASLNDGITPFSATIVTVVDHSGTPLNSDSSKRHPWYWKHPPSCGPNDDPILCPLIIKVDPSDGKIHHGDGIVKAYNQETGFINYGENCPPGVGYKKR